MQYLGGMRGAGTVTCGDRKLARAEYDFEGFLVKPGEVAGSGELKMAAEAMREIFGRKNIELVTDDGRRLSLRFSEKKLSGEGDIAHVDVAGELPPAAEWRH